LSDGHFYRVGGHNAVKTNVRVIAATHQDLEQRVKQGAFREDLFHRLNVIRLRLPALRERREDVPMLTRHFLLQSAHQLGVEPKRISEAALDLLGTFQFPGNVRQLENICHWLTVMAPAQVIESKDLPPEVIGVVEMGGVLPITLPAGVTSLPAAYTSPVVDERIQKETAVHATFNVLGDTEIVVTHDWESELANEALSLLATERNDVWDVLTQRFESCLIQAALSTTRGRRIEAALKLGIGRNTITRKIQELGIGD
jgi:two-component system nitrogen regulation response regulator GlnG